MAPMSQGPRLERKGLQDVARPSSATKESSFLVQRPRWTQGGGVRDNSPSGEAGGPSASYLCYKGIMKGRRGCPLQVYAGPPAGDLGSVLSGASCEKRMKERL